MKGYYLIFLLLISFSFQEDELVLNNKPISNILNLEETICYKIKYNESYSNIYLNIISKTKNVFLYYNNFSDSSLIIQSTFKQIEFNENVISSIKSICFKSSDENILMYEIQLISHSNVSYFNIKDNILYTLKSNKGETISYKSNNIHSLKALVRKLNGEINVKLNCIKNDNCDIENYTLLTKENYFFSKINPKENLISIECINENSCEYSIIYYSIFDEQIQLDENFDLYNIISDNKTDLYNIYLNDNLTENMYLFVYSFMNDTKINIENNKEINVVSYYFDNVKIFEFNRAFKYNNSLMGNYNISISSNGKCIYSIYYSTKFKNLNNKLLFKDYPVLSFVPFDKEKEIFEYDFNNEVYKKGYKIMFQSINCNIDIKSKNKINKLSNDTYELPITHSIYNTSLIFSISINNMERNSFFYNEKCFFYTKFINVEKSEILLSTSNLFKVNLNDNFNNIQLNYKYDILNENIISYFKFNENKLFIEVLQDDQIIKKKIIDEDSIITIKKEEINVKENPINIIFNIEGHFNSNRKSLFFETSLSYLNLNKPKYLSRNEYKDIYIYPNEELNFYSELGKNEFGEIIFDLINYNNYSINAKIYRKTYNSSEEIFKYFENKFNDNKVINLYYDKIKSLIQINPFDTGFCSSGCELLLSIKSNNLKLNKFSMVFKTNQGNQKPIIIKENQYIFGNIDSFYLNEKSEIFLYYLKEDNFDFEIKCQLCEINILDQYYSILSNHSFSGDKKIIHFQFDNNIFSNEFIFIQLRNIRTEYYLDSFYNFRIIKKKNLNSFIEFHPYKDTICKIKNENSNLCLFILSRDELKYYEDDLNLYYVIYDHNQTNKLYIKNIEYDFSSLPNIKDNLDIFISFFNNLNSLKNENGKLLNFKIKKNVNQIIIVYSEQIGNIYLTNTLKNINETKDLILSPYYSMIMKLDNYNKLKENSIEEINKRIISLNKEIIFADNQLNDNANIIEYYFPNTNKLKEIVQDELEYITFGNSLELYTRVDIKYEINNENEINQDYIFYISLYSISEYDNYYYNIKSKHTFSLKAFFVDADYINKTQNSNTLTSFPFSIELEGKFDENLLLGYLKISNNNLKYAKDNNLRYLYFQLNQNEDNYHLYNEIKGKVIFHSNNLSKIFFPSNMYFIDNTLNYNKNEKLMYHFYNEDNSINSYMKIEFIPKGNYYNLTFYSDEEINEKPEKFNLNKSSDNFKIEGPFVEFGKIIYYIELSRNYKSVYTLISYDTDFEYILNYQIFINKDDYNKYNKLSEQDFILVKTQFSNYSLKIPKLNISNKEINVEYYLYNNYNDNYSLSYYNLNYENNFINIKKKIKKKDYTKYQILGKVIENENIYYQIYTFVNQKVSSNILFDYSKKINDDNKEEEEEEEKEEENKIPKNNEEENNTSINNENDENINDIKNDNSQTLFFLYILLLIIFIIIIFIIFLLKKYKKTKGFIKLYNETNIAPSPYPNNQL